MKEIPDASVDMILTDPPYGMTACKWDQIIPFDAVWKQYWRILKKNSAVLLFGVEPFSSYLRLSQIQRYKYDWIWHKTQATGHLNCRKQPMRNVEVISVFYESQPNYTPQMTDKDAKNIRKLRPRKNSSCYGKFAPESSRLVSIEKSFPTQILNFANTNHGERGLHPTQKPVALLEYLIKTYTKEGQIVLDSCMGSGSTGVACLNVNRRFIGIEKDKNFFKIAQKRILGVDDE